jgi:hypothetical protein
MGGNAPNKKVVENLLERNSKYLIYAIGTQECMRSIFKSFFISDKKEWINFIGYLLNIKLY